MNGELKKNRFLLSSHRVPRIMINEYTNTQKMRKILCMRGMMLTALALVTFTLCAQSPREAIDKNPNLAASNYLAYIVPTAKLTAAPKGYEPFYITHYGRHGSRWLIGDDEYANPYKVFKKAYEEGALTPYGQEIYYKLEKVYNASLKRLGELSPLGHRQHRGIAERMYRNFPAVFKGNTRVDAKSTVVIRCILSMTGETQRLAELNPSLRIATDASYHDMYYMNNSADNRRLNEHRRGGREALNEFRRQHVHSQRVMDTLFCDTSYIKKNIKTEELYDQLFGIATNQQSLDLDFNFNGLFTRDELYNTWLNENAGWYVDYGPSPLSDGVMPFSQRFLLKNFLDTADTCVVSRNNNVTLRFGHEVCVLPLACLMELGNAGTVEPDLEKLADKWQNYNIFPMASNIQWIFYRSKKAGDEVLVKALLNEREVTLPVKSDLAPYYRWKDVEAYYRTKLATYKEEPKEKK